MSGAITPPAAPSAGPSSRRWRAVLALCVLVVAVEGYDVQAMAFAAPLIAKAWGVRAGAIGLLLTASVAGIIGGSVLLAPLGDRIGRRRSVLAGLLVASVFTLGCAFAHDLATLALVRAVAGFGLGMAMPNIIAISLEVAPTARRAFAVIIANGGYPLGAAAGGALASRLVSGGFSMIFLIGAGATVFALAVSAVALPETFVGRTPRSEGSAAAIEAQRTRLLAQLFSPKYALGTALFWMLNFFGIAIVYFFVSWLPTLLSLNGMSNRQTLVATAIFNVSGVVGGVAMAYVQRRMHSLDILAAAYSLAIVAVLGLAFVRDPHLLIGVLVLSGAVIAGSQFVLNAAVNRFYPAEIRAGASGYAVGVGRLGAIAAPMAGGVILAATHSARTAFLLIVVPAGAALLSAVYLRLARQGGQGRILDRDQPPAGAAPLVAGAGE